MAGDGNAEMRGDEKMIFRETLAGLDIGDRQVAAAQVLASRDGRLTVQYAGVQEYAPDASDAQIAGAVRALWQKHHFPTFTVCSCLRSQSLTLKHFGFSGISERDLLSALKLEAEEALQIPPDRITFDWHLSRNDPVQGGSSTSREIEGVLVAAPSAEVDRHLAILKMAGLYAVVMDVGPLAISNLFCALRNRKASEKSVCIVNLGRRTADISFLYNEASIYPRSVFSRAADWVENPRYLADNIQDALKFYQFKLRRESVQQILVCGQIPGAKNYLDQLGQAIGVPVEAWDPVQEVELSMRTRRVFAGNNGSMGSAMAVSLGLALRGDLGA
jgi:Tfp pilus assembly PilM family ATPase